MLGDVGVIGCVFYENSEGFELLTAWILESLGH